MNSDIVRLRVSLGLSHLARARDGATAPANGYASLVASVLDQNSRVAATVQAGLDQLVEQFAPAALKVAIERGLCLNSVEHGNPVEPERMELTEDGLILHWVSPVATQAFLSWEELCPVLDSL